MDLKDHGGTLATEALADFKREVEAERRLRETIRAEHKAALQAARRESEEQEHKSGKLSRPYGLLKQLVQLKLVDSGAMEAHTGRPSGLVTTFDIGPVGEGVKGYLKIAAKFKIKVPAGSPHEVDFEIATADLALGLLSDDNSVEKQYHLAQYRDTDNETAGNIDEDAVPGFIIVRTPKIEDSGDYVPVTLDSPQYDLLSEVLSEALEYSKKGYIL